MQLLCIITASNEMTEVEMKQEVLGSQAQRCCLLAVLLISVGSVPGGTPVRKRTALASRIQKLST